MDQELKFSNESATDGDIKTMADQCNTVADLMKKGQKLATNLKTWIKASD